MFSGLLFYHHISSADRKDQSSRLWPVRNCQGGKGLIPCANDTYYFFLMTPPFVAWAAGLVGGHDLRLLCI